MYIPTKTTSGTIGDITLAFEYAIAAMSLNLVLGYAGIISIGHSAFFGLGMYTTAILVDPLRLEPGLDVLRRRGDRLRRRLRRRPARPCG